MLIATFIPALLAIFCFDTVSFIVSALRKRNDYADIIWGPGFVVAAGAALLFGPVSHAANDLRLWVAFGLVTFWALRLAWHIGLRNLAHSEEDARYANWRRDWGKTWIWRSYLQVFLLQGVILILIDTSLIWIVANQPKDFDIWCAIGIAVWLTGFLFESIADAQLSRFKKTAKKGQIMTTGLWSWSRHPNYFGEVVQWWGIAFFSVGLPLGWITLISPVMITFFILKVSGVPMLEELMKGREGFAEYKRRTSEFFPLPPKKA